MITRIALLLAVLAASSLACVFDRPAAHCPNPNEYRNKCATRICDGCPKSVESDPICPQDNPNTVCESGCVCISKHKRNSEGNCVPQDQCPFVRG